MNFVRSFNPIWWIPDLVGNPLDDTYYMFVLENTIPYIPTPVYQTPSGIPWADPVQFLSNGTLPENIYWDPGTSTTPMVYRLEFRKGATQSDPLIYLVENYIPDGEGGSNPNPSIGFTTDNQISNAQFSIVNFQTPWVFTSTLGATLEVAPGWSLVLGAPSGTGSVTITQVPLNDSAGSINPTNAPYALEINSSGWSSMMLVQQFSQNGMLWTTNTTEPSYVSCSITAESQGTLGVITAQLVDSHGTNLGIFDSINNLQLTNSWNEYKGIINMPPTTNPDFPPTAYVQFQLVFNTPNIDVFITSFQIVNSNLPLAFTYEEDTIERQQDYLFHYYNPLLQNKPIPSHLVGWDFKMNPAQFGISGTLGAIGANKCNYIVDQTILFQTVDNSLSWSINADNASTAQLIITPSKTTQWALIQYLDQRKTFDMIQNLLCSAFKGTSTTSNITGSISLWYTTDATLPNMPVTTNHTAFFGGLDATGIPTTPAGTWTQLNNKYGAATFSVDGLQHAFRGWDGTDMSSSAPPYATYFAIVFGTGLVTSSNAVNVEYISLQSGDIATEPAPQTFDEVLRECQYYYETSYPVGFSPGAVATSYLSSTQCGNGSIYGTYVGGSFLTYKRNNMQTANQLLIYSTGAAGAPATGSITVYNPVSGAYTDKVLLTYFNQNFLSNSGYKYLGNTAVMQSGSSTQLVALWHYVADARLGNF